MITVFTSTYNRAYRLPNLYKSLCKQTSKNFEWLIVDDGSKDNTKELCDEWIKEGLVDIRYYFKENGGKHRAINLGVLKAKGELFFIVDSDDELEIDSIEAVEKMYDTIKTDTSFAGVSGLKILPNGEPVAGYLQNDFVDWYMYERKYDYDMSEVYRTEVLKKYPFPDFEGENFCAESLIWNRIGLHYRIRYFNKGIYQCEYLGDGLSANNLRNRRNSPSYACLLYKELQNKKFPLKWRVNGCINYWRFWLVQRNRNLEILPFYMYLLFPLGWLLKIKDDMNV